MLQQRVWCKCIQWYFKAMVGNLVTIAWPRISGYWSNGICKFYRRRFWPLESLSGLGLALIYEVLEQDLNLSNVQAWEIISIMLCKRTFNSRTLQYIYKYILIVFASTQVVVFLNLVMSFTGHLPLIWVILIIYNALFKERHWLISYDNCPPRKEEAWYSMN